MTVHDVRSQGLEQVARGTSFGETVPQTRRETEFVHRDGRSIEHREKRIAHG